MNTLFIFRRDFRIRDNTGLNSLLENNDTIFPIFIFTPEQITNNTYKSDNCVQFMVKSLFNLKKYIEITMCYGMIESVIEDIVYKNNITKICVNTDYTPYAIKREENIKKLAEKLKISFIYYHDILLFEPGTILNSTGDVYKKFTPFYNTIIKKKVPDVKNLKLKNIKKPITKFSINSSKIINLYIKNDNIHIEGGRDNAIKILKNIKNFSQYNTTHNYLSCDTTNLSAYLKFGCISIREAYHCIKNNKNKALLRQLIWREFYYCIGYGYIGRFGKPMNIIYENIKWDNNKHKFKLWCNGMTGFPIVDACMTQLNNTGYMHNRGRLIVASFLIKNLHINWKWGEKYFATKLVDYDPLVNQGNWEWVAGCGADSMPYFRVFNPWLQSAKYDIDCTYIKKWLPVLKDVENKAIHKWDLYYSSYKINYYKPIVDYYISKMEMLVRYKKIFS